MKVIGVVLIILDSGLMAPLVTADVFCDNFKLLSATLPQNISSSPRHFVTATAGQAPDVVYELVNFPGDVNNSAWSQCVSDVLDNKLYPQCQYKYGTFYNPDARCIIGFSSSENFLSPYNVTTDNDTPFERWNIKNITGDADNVRFIAGLIHELLAETVQRAAAETAILFATEIMDSGETFPRVHSMAWCTPYMSADDCSACLRRLTGMINSTMSIRIGGQMGVLWCYFRYGATKFCDGEPMVQLGVNVAAPAPAPPMVPTRETHKQYMNKLSIIPMAVVSLVVASFCFIFCSCWLRRYKGNSHDLIRRIKNLQGEDEWVWGSEGKNSEFLMFDFDQIMEATGNFSEENKLGQGGFGAVFKGRFSDGVEIAVKRLASHSKQGFTEFKNEVHLIAKLQHRNLVRLLGCCTQGEEKLLVYEYLPNKSLDFFIFDENNRALLDWCKRLAIIEGIAHGLLYLHKHSRLSVIHRDLKPSNILLDREMNPKISDFGLARIFNSDKAEGTATIRVVGTYGYMAPEYSSVGIFSIKSDVFSFGVLALETICGRRNFGSHQCEDFINLFGYAWQIWQEGRWLELIDTTLVSDSHSEEMMRCVNITLLCVQENAADRPTMSDVIAMLSSKTMILAEPKHPGYFNARVGNEEPSTVTKPCTVNEMTISVLSGR